MTDTDRDHDVIDAFIGVADRLVEDIDVLDLSIQLTEDLARLIDGTSVGLLLADAGGVLHLLAGTSTQTRSLELFQLQGDEGPCLDCYHSGQPVDVPDLGSETDRWPRFVAAAAEQGFVSVHAIPMRIGGQVLGALGLFGTTPTPLADTDLRLARALVHVACIALVQQGHAGNRANLLATLQLTVLSRALLEMAKGVLADTHGMSMDDASLLLREYAHEHNQLLADVARALITVSDPHQKELLADVGGTTVPPRQQNA